MHLAALLGLVSIFTNLGQAATIQKRKLDPFFEASDLKEKDWEIKAPHDGQVQEIPFAKFGFGTGGSNAALEAKINKVQQQAFVQGSEINLVIIPSDNAQKMRHIQMIREENTVYIVTKVDSDVGEQPFNAAGPKGAINRIVNALKMATNDQFKVFEGSVLVPSQKTFAQFCQENKIGKLFVVSIENYISGELDSIDSINAGDAPHGLNSDVQKILDQNPKVPSLKGYDYTLKEGAVDYGAATGLSWSDKKAWGTIGGGVRVPRPKKVDLVKFAMSRGVKLGLGTRVGVNNDGPIYGDFTVGSVIKLTTKPDPRLSEAEQKKYDLGSNWHWYVSGGKVDRWAVLEKAVLALGTVLFAGA